MDVALEYHRAWTSGHFREASALLADDLAVEVPINDYPTAASFMEAVASFGGSAERVDLLTSLGGTEDAMLLYDMTVPGLGTLRVVEHFTVHDGRIVRIRQIHDTAAIRAIAG